MHVLSSAVGLIPPTPCCGLPSFYAKCLRPNMRHLRAHSEFTCTGIEFEALCRFLCPVPPACLRWRPPSQASSWDSGMYADRYRPKIRVDRYDCEVITYENGSSEVFAAIGILLIFHKSRSSCAMNTNPLLLINGRTLHFNSRVC